MRSHKRSLEDQKSPKMASGPGTAGGGSKSADFGSKSVNFGVKMGAGSLKSTSRVPKERETYKTKRQREPPTTGAPCVTLACAEMGAVMWAFTKFREGKGRGDGMSYT